VVLSSGGAHGCHLLIVRVLGSTVQGVITQCESAPGARNSLLGGPLAGRQLVVLRAEALRTLDVLREVRDAARKRPVGAPADLRSTRAANPVVPQVVPRSSWDVDVPLPLGGHPRAPVKQDVEIGRAHV